MRTRHFLSALTVLSFVACGTEDPEATPTPDPEVTADELVALLPTADMLLAQYPGYVAARVSAQDGEAPQQASCQAVEDETTAHFYQQGCSIILYVNGVVQDVMTMLDNVTSHQPTHQGGGVYVWGPWDNGTGQTLMFGMQKNEDGTIGYKMDGKVVGAEDSTYVTLLAGHIEAGSSLAHNVGNFNLSYDNMKAIKPEMTTGGAAEYAYDSLDAQTGVEAKMKALTWKDGLTHNSVVKYYVNEDTSGELFYGLTDDLKVVEGSDAQELLKVHTRWLSTGTGRADATVTEGDLEGTGYASQCWAADYTAVYTQTNWGTMTGDQALCAFEEPQFPQS